jgi:hypothetical protein
MTPLIFHAIGTRVQLDVLTERMFGVQPDVLAERMFGAVAGTYALN